MRWRTRDSPRRGWKAFGTSTPGKLLLGVAAVDALLLSAHGLHQVLVRADPEGWWPLPFRRRAVWNGGADGSLVELWGLLQLSSAAVLLVLLARRVPKHGILGTWGTVLLVMVADDLLRLHERAGAFLDLDHRVPALSAAGGQELGGLAFWVAVGTVLSVALVRSYTTSAAPARRAALILLAVTAPLGAVAVSYVLLSAFGGGLGDGTLALVLADVRVTVKLLSMTACLVLALHWSRTPPSTTGFCLYRVWDPAAEPGPRRPAEPMT
ncbi:hypothetical protein [Kocuria sp. CPCC 205263]|uniref:hypothetical protein n=1 Tax=Kocuria sp. CPCC 205263 TaxID=3073555 RepID=UPI0034D4F762